MKSGRRVSVHLLLDAQSVYNEHYHNLKLSLGLKHGAALVAEHQRKLECEKEYKDYEPSAAVDEMALEVCHEAFCVEPAEDIKVRSLSRTQELTAINYENSSSLASARAVLTQFPDDVNNGLANLSERLPPVLQHALFLQANKNLLARLEADVAQGGVVFVANGSSRQFQVLNVFHQLTQDTGCIFEDLYVLTNALRKSAKNPATVGLDALTLYDVINEIPDGEHYKHVLAKVSQYSCSLKNKEPALASIYLHAHYHACKHGDLPIELHCYVSSADALVKLQRSLDEYQGLMPVSVNINIHHYTGEVIASVSCRGTAKADEQYRQRAKLVNKNPADMKISEPLPSPEKCSINLLDADNCIYNVFYFQLLALLVEQYGEKIVANRSADMKCAEVVALGKEMQDFVENCPADKLFNKVSYSSMLKLRNPLVEKFSAIILDEDIIKVRDGMLAEDKTVFDKNRHGPIFCQLIRIIEAMNPTVMSTILFRTNDLLFDEMMRTAKAQDATKIVNLIGSLRQSYHNDLRNSIWNGTGRFHLDIIRLNRFLNVQFKEKEFTFVVDTATVVDFSYDLDPGMHVSSSSLDVHHVIEVSNDVDKIRTVYAMMHYARRKYHASEINFFDDTLRIFKAIKTAFGHKDQYGLLPIEMKLNMFGYDGDFMGHCSVVTGAGSVDQHPYTLTQHTSFVKAGEVAVRKLELRSLPSVRTKETPVKVGEFVELIRWSQPALFAPSAVKTDNKIKQAMDVLRQEIKRLSNGSGDVSHGFYAHRMPMPIREITAQWQDMINGGTRLVEGLATIILLARDNKPIEQAATKLRNLVCGSGEYERANMRLMNP